MTYNHVCILGKYMYISVNIVSKIGEPCIACVENTLMDGACLACAWHLYSRDRKQANLVFSRGSVHALGDAVANSIYRNFRAMWLYGVFSWPFLPFVGFLHLGSCLSRFGSFFLIIHTHTIYIYILVDFRGGYKNHR